MYVDRRFRYRYVTYYTKQYLIINLNLPPETSQDTSTVLPSAYGPMVVEASRPDSSTITGVLGGTENRDYVLLNVALDKNGIDT